MKCVICKTGTTRKDKASLTVEKRGAFLVFANVKAEVCTNCGEAYFSAGVASRPEEKAQSAFQKGKQIELVKL